MSPVLSCLYASEVLEKINANPIYSSEQLPVVPRSYVDDIGFLMISDSLEENIILRHTLYKAEKHFNEIGMHIDPEKSDLMHFSWRNNDKKSPHLTAVLEGQIVTIIPPPYIRWLGFYLDRKLSFKHHTDILCAKAKNVISGLTCLGNTITGLNQNNLRLLFKTCVIPVITYRSQLWFNPYSPKKLLINKLQVVQNLGLRRVTGTFRTTNTEALMILTYQPPIQITIHKLFESCTARFFRLPLSSEISLQLPMTFIPPTSLMHILIPGSSLSPKQHIPFIRPPFLRGKPRKNPQKFSQITLLASTLEPDMEHQLPYHDHCHPGTFCETSNLFQDRLFFEWKPTPKKSRKSLLHKQNIVMANVHQSVNILLILTDGSRIPDHGTGYSVVGYYMGEEIHRRSIKFADNASNFDAEMYALAQAAEDIQRYVKKNPKIDIVLMYSDNSGAIKIIFNLKPHPSQAASIQFRIAIHDIFIDHPNLKLHLMWTPGHGGTAKMK